MTTESTTAFELGRLAASLGYQPEPVAWDIGETELVPMSRWGRDHWNVLAYVETRWVDHHGQLNHDQMRVDPDRHPLFASARRLTMPGTTKYPTRLKTVETGSDGCYGAEELVDHDDYDCLGDAIRLGLVTVVMPTANTDGDVFFDARGRTITDAGGEPVHPSFVTGLGEWQLMAAASFQFTEAGQRIAAQLRAHRAVSRNSHQFTPRSES